MTILEITVVILVMLAIIGITFTSARSWKRGSDRAMCVMNMEYVQKGVRSLSNLYGYNPGTTVQGLRDQVVGTGRFVEFPPVCPGGGLYTFSGGGDLIPPVGELYMSCSLSDSDQHRPSVVQEW